MRIPGDRPLESWIRDLMEHDRLYAFYQSDDWQELRDAVLLDHNYECEMCAAEGRYGRADTVHHEHEVRREPSMALTRFVTTDDGGEARGASSPLQPSSQRGSQAHVLRAAETKDAGQGQALEPTRRDLVDTPPYPIWGQFGGYLQR